MALYVGAWPQAPFFLELVGLGSWLAVAFLSLWAQRDLGGPTKRRTPRGRLNMGVGFAPRVFFGAVVGCVGVGGWCGGFWRSWLAVVGLALAV